MGTPDNQESLLAISLADGKALWSVPTGGSVFQEGHGNGPRSTPTVDGGQRLCAGRLGRSDLRRHQVEIGPLAQELAAGVCRTRPAIWLFGIGADRRPQADLHARRPGRDDRRARQGHAARSSGSARFRRCPGRLRSPIVADVGGTRQYIDVVSRGVVGVKAADGQFPLGQRHGRDANVICSTPLFIKDHVFVSASYGAGAALIHLVPGDQGDSRRTSSITASR